MRAFLSLAVLSIALILVVACSPRYLKSAAVELTRMSTPVASLTRNVILVSIDGLRPDAIDHFKATTLQRLVREGSSSMSARTIMPSTTLPSHTSMLSGEPPDEHGVFWNNVHSAEKDHVDVSTVFSVAREHGYRTAAFFSKAKFGALQRPGTLDYSQAPGGWWGRWPSTRTIADVRSYLETDKPNLLFVHLSDPDRAGHSSGWMSADYGRAVIDADIAVKNLMQAADTAYGAGNYSLLVTADHGGHAYGHGTSDPLDVTIPWIAWGRGVTAGVLKESIDTFDTAPTVLWLLGVKEPDAWDGDAVVEAFQTEVVAATD
jgi:predicted AlkP superfamily pyrophosphatase or phosphodiesterase